MLVGNVQANILWQQSHGWTIALYSNSSYQFQIKQNILFKSNFVNCSEKIQICANRLQNGLCNKLYCYSQNKVFLRMKETRFLNVVWPHLSVLFEQIHQWALALYR
jgi:hypothetical protein